MYVEMCEKKTNKWSIISQKSLLPTQLIKEIVKEWENTIQNQFKCNCDGVEIISFFQNEQYAFKVHEVPD